MKPQPFDPPVPSASVWVIPRDAIPDIASMFYEQVMWGREPHHSQVSQTDMRAWESVRARWERATERVLARLQDVGHVVVEDENAIRSALEAEAEG